MRKLMALVLGVLLLSPAVAFAGSAATNAALGLGAFAVFNQMLGGVGLFGGFARPVYAAPAPVVYAPAPPRIVYAPPPVVYAPPPVVYAPAPLVYAPPPLVYAPAPTVVMARPVVVHRPHVVRYPHSRPIPQAVMFRRW